MAEPYYMAESLEPDSSFGYLIKRCGVLMSQIAERAFDSQPVSFMQWMILISLAKRPQHASPSELSEQLGHDMGGLTRVVDELERLGLVLRERSREDRRAVKITVTPEGRRLAHAGKRVIAGLMNQLVEPYSKAEVDALIAMLQRLYTDLQAAAEASTPSDIARPNRRTAEPREARAHARRKAHRRGPLP